MKSDIDQAIRDAAHFERIEAGAHLGALLDEWRKDLWPSRYDDPIYWEETNMAWRTRWILGVVPSPNQLANEGVTPGVTLP